MPNLLSTSLPLQIAVGVTAVAVIVGVFVVTREVPQNTAQVSQPAQVPDQVVVTAVDKKPVVNEPQVVVSAVTAGTETTKVVADAADVGSVDQTVTVQESAEQATETAPEDEATETPQGVAVVAAVENPVAQADGQGGAKPKIESSDTDVTALALEAPSAPLTQAPVVTGQGVAPAAPLAVPSAQDGIANATAPQAVAPAADVLATTSAQVIADAGPRFDLVRVDTQGAALIAGTAEPGAEVQVTLGASALDTVRADQNGAFVAMVQLPAGDSPQTVGLRQLMEGNQVIASAQTVLVVPPPIQEDVAAAPTIVIADPTGAEVLQSASLAQVEVAEHPLSLEAISYDQGGAVVLAGRGSGDQFVRVYVNNRPVETEPVPDDGNWRVVLPDVDQGLYTIRVDEVNASGSVLARVESPFKRVAPAQVQAALDASEDKSTVIVQPGHTLWALAQDRYGDGVQYVAILNANRDLIRDANLIYPGQVFDIPE